MLVPLYGFLRGDTLGVIVLVHDDHPIRTIGRQVKEAAACRIEPAALVDIYCEGELLPPNQTVAQVGLQPFAKIEVVPRGSN